MPPNINMQLSDTPIIDYVHVSWATNYYQIISTHELKNSAYWKNNSIELNLKPKVQNTNKCLASGLYKLTSADWGKVYVSQTGRNFSKRYKEHHQAFRNNSISSKFAQRLNDNIHSWACGGYYACVTLKKNPPHLNIIERLYLYKDATSGNQLYNKHAMFPSIVFDTIIKTEISNYLLITFQVIPSFLHTLSTTPHSPYPYRSQTMPSLPSEGLQRPHRQFTAMKNGYP